MTPVGQCFGTAGVIAVSFVALGCARPSTAALERARAAYEDASQDEQVIENAPLALQDARQTLERAERAPNEKDTTSLAYVVERKVEIARANAEERVAEKLARRLSREQASARGGCRGRGPRAVPSGGEGSRRGRSCRPTAARGDASPVRP